MGGIRRYFEEGFVYFVTTATKERKQIFCDRKLCRILLVTVEYFKMIFDYQIYGFCIMPDHVHLIIKPTERFDLSFVMKMIKGSFARKVNKLRDQKGALWQARYYDEVIRDQKQLWRQVEYVHQNPVVAGIVTQPAEYAFSSFSQYHGILNSEGRILEIDSIN
ncbi:MAG: transposase [Candidatus Omnitrophica bacterium]|nr:transposase [Candidatus Omnitrophota bacterium]